MKAPTPAPRSVSTAVYSLEFRGATITSDAGLLACRELDDALGLTETADECLQESRGGRNVQHRLVGLLRQSVYSRLAGYEDINDPVWWADDPIGVQPWELPSSVMPAQGGQALVAAERADQAGQDGRPSGAALSSIDLPVVRGVGSSKAVPGSVGSHRPVIAGAKLREGTTTILPRGRALQGAGLSSMRFHPTGEGPEDDKDGQVAWFTARIASLIG